MNNYYKEYRELLRKLMNSDVKQKVKIVYGSPRSGKTTYVKTNMKENDTVIDLDYIISSLQLSESRKKDNHNLQLALDIRDFLYQKVRNNDKNIKCDTIWIIGGFPEKEKRERLREDFGAELIYIDTDKDTCIQRSINDNLYGDVSYSEQVVNDWWDKYQK